MKSSIASPLLIFFCFSTFSLPSNAAEWTQDEVSNAVAIVKARQQGGLAGCVRDSGTEIVRSVEQIDLNNDGINEVVIRSVPKVFGTGATSCFGPVGQELSLLISDGQGGWNHQFGFDMHAMIYHQSAGDWPDIEMTGPGFCFPVWRFHQGNYGVWKVCDQQGHSIYADAAPWITEGAVPRDSGEDVEAGAQTASADDIWRGDYWGDCGNNVQCSMEIENADGGSFKVAFTVADRMDARSVKCRIEGNFTPSTSLRIEGNVEKAGKVSIRADSGDLEVLGIPNKACGVRIGGIFQVLGH